MSHAQQYTSYASAINTIHVISHNLKRESVNVVVFDAANDEQIIPAGIKSLSDTQVQITFFVPVAIYGTIT